MGVRGAVEWVTAAAVGVALLVGSSDGHAQQQATNQATTTSAVAPSAPTNAQVQINATPSPATATRSLGVQAPVALTFQAAPAASGCPYAARWRHCGGGRDVFRWGTTGLSIALLATAVSLHVASVTNALELAQQYSVRDPNHVQPVSAYSDLAALAAQRQTLQNVAIGFYVGGGLLALGSAVMWMIPRGAHCAGRHCPRRNIPAVAFDAGPGSVALTASF